MPPKAAAKPKSAEKKPVAKKGAVAPPAADGLSACVTIRCTVTAVAKSVAPAEAAEEPEVTPEVTFNVSTGMDFFSSSAVPGRAPMASSEEMPAINSRGGLPFEWSDEQEVLVDEAMVRELVSRKGRTAVTLRFRSLAESEPGDTECSLALDCATLLLGATAVEATWLAASAAPGDLLLQEHYASVHVRLEVKQPDSNDAQEADSTAGIRPPKVTLVPDELLKKLAPVLITPIKAAGLPDLPATKDSLSSSCYPVSLWYKFLGDDLNAHTHDGAPTAWQESSLEGLPATRDVLFGQSDIVLCGDLAPGQLRALCDRGTLELRVYDRWALPEEEAKLYVPRGDRVKAQAPAADAKPAKGAKAGVPKQETPPLDSAESEPAEEPECPVFGVARFSLHRLAAGDVDVKLRANVVPVTQLKGGAELDWKSRPGKYVEAAAYMVLRVRAALPLSRPEMEVNPYARVVFLTEYKDSELYTKLRLLVRKNNIQALNLQGTETHILTTLTTYKLEPEQQQDSNFDLLTGFQLVDGQRRLVIIEGLAYGAMQEVASIAKQAAEAAAGSKTTILFNERLRYPTRLYGGLGADLWPLKLCKPLPTLLAVAGNMTGNRLRPECMEALKKLNKLVDQSWMREVDRMQLFPLYPMLNALDKRFAGELTVEDLEGKPLAVRVRKAVMRTGSEVQRASGGTPADVADETFMKSTQSRGALKAALDMDNSAYLAIIKRQREIRLERDFHYVYMETLPQLYATSGAPKKSEFLSSNPQRTWERTSNETLDTQRMHRRLAAQNQLNPPAGHARNFQFPCPTQPHEYMQLEKKPSGARVEELRHAWVENENSRPVVDADDGANLFQTVFRGAREGGELFDQSLEHYSSVFAVPEELAMQEEYERVVKELERWRAKVVDSTSFHTTFPFRKQPGQIDKHQLMLHGPRKKMGISGRSKLEPSVQSIFLEAPWEGAGQWEDFRPKQTKNRLQQTEPKHRPSAHLRKLEAERFMGTKQRGDSLVPEDFNRFMPLKDPTAVHRRAHVDGILGHPEQPPKIHLHHPLPLPPPPFKGSIKRRPGTPPLPFG